MPLLLEKRNIFDLDVDAVVAPVRQVFRMEVETGTRPIVIRTPYGADTYIEALAYIAEKRLMSVSMPLLERVDDDGLDVADEIRRFLDRDECADMFVYLVPQLPAGRGMRAQPEELRQRILPIKAAYGIGKEKKRRLLSKPICLNTQPDNTEVRFYGTNTEMLCAPRVKDELEASIRHKAAGFSETLLELIERKGFKKDSDCYNKANITRQLFSKIRSDACYHPTKQTALAFALALELNIEETNDFIAKAGYVLTKSDNADIIVTYCIEHGIYDIVTVNEWLFEYDQPLLGMNRTMRD